MPGPDGLLARIRDVGYEKLARSARFRPAALDVGKTTDEALLRERFGDALLSS